MTTDQIRAALQQRLADRQYTLNEARRELEILNSVIRSHQVGVEELTWAIEQLGAPAPLGSEENPVARPRAPRADLQGLVLDIVLNHREADAAQIAAKLGRKTSEITRTLAALMKSGKIARNATAAGFYAIGDAPVAVAAPQAGEVA